MNSLIRLIFHVAFVTLMFASAGCQNRLGDDNAVVYPVLEEPMHKSIFHNDQLDAYEVRMQPGESSFFHRHTRDQLAVIMRTSTSLNQMLGSPETEMTSQRGTIAYIPHSVTGGYTHRVKAAGDQEFWVLGIEFVKPAGGDAKSTFIMPEQQSFEFPGGLVTRLTIAPNTRETIEGSIIISMSSGSLAALPNGEAHLFKEGSLKWVNSAPVTYANKGGNPVSLIVITLEDSENTAEIN